MSSLPPCNLSKRCCKCGGDDILTRWVKALPFSGRTIAIPRPQMDRLMKDRLDEGEHMARNCRVCGYRWAEAPLDQCSAVDQLAAKADA